MSSNVLKTLPGELDIKIHLPRVFSIYNSRGGCIQIKNDIIGDGGGVGTIVVFAVKRL